MIYLDNAATSYFKPQIVIDNVANYLKSPGNPGRGVNKISVASSSIVLDTRMKIASFFNFDDFSKVIFTSGITESLNTIINGVVEKEDHVITTILEHNSSLRPLYHKKCNVSFCNGDISEIKKSVKKNTKAVIINHASNVTGEVQDIETIGKWCRQNNLIFIVDAAQTAGVIPIDVKKMCIDILCFTGHKGLLGMQGVGGMIVNTDTYIEPLKFGGTGVQSFCKKQPNEYPNHLEAGTLNVPGIVSLNSSIDYINEKGIENIYNHEISLRKKIYDYLQSKNHIEIYENKNKEAIGVLSFNIKNVDAAYVGDYLSNECDICVRTGAHCAPLVLKHYNIESTIRVSVGLNNTEKDIDMLIDAIERYSK